MIKVDDSMKVLLMLPINRSYVVMPSLGVGYIASVLRASGHNVSILHCLHRKFDFNDFKEYIQRHKFNVIGIQMFTYDIKPVKKHLDIIKKYSSDTITVLGGYHPSGSPKSVLKEFSKADFAFASEVEIAFPEFLKQLKKKKPNFKKVPNLIWRKGKQVKENPVVVEEDLDKIPFPAWDLIDPRTYPEAPHGAFFKSFPCAPIIITRGCPYPCTFCAGKTITTKKIRKRSVKNVIAEIKLLKNKYGVNEFLIEDENLTLHRQLLIEFCETLINEKLNINWSCPAGIRIDTITKKILVLMEKAGCHSVSLGIEFGSQRIHNLTKKNLTIKTIKEKINLFKEVDIRTTGFFLFGIPGEKRDEMLQTIKFAKSLAIDRAQFNNYMPLPGSDIYYNLKKSGEKIDHNHSFVHDVGYVPKGMTRKGMKNIQRRAYLEFYLRPRIVLGLLRDIQSLSHFLKLFQRFLDGLK